MHLKGLIALAMAVLIGMGEAFAADPVSHGVRILRSEGTGRVQPIPHELLFSGPISPVVKTWTQDMLKVAQVSQSAQRAELQPPQSLIYRGSRSRRFSNAEAADKLKYTLFRAMPGILNEVQEHIRLGRRGMSLDTVLENFKGKVRENYTGGDGVADVRDKMEARLSTQWDGMRSGLRLDDFEAGDVLGGAQDYLRAFESNRDRFQGSARDIFSQEVRSGAAFGNLGSRVILSSLGLNPASPEAIMALTLLHPITDDALDRGMDVGSSMARISRVLEGEKLTAANPYEEVVFTLIGDIFQSFLPTDHPILQQVLIQLHRAQLESVQVQKSGSSVDRWKLLELTVRKGGLTALALAYVSIGSLRADETEFFFKAGTLFQLGDDLMDVAEDGRDGTTTLWTSALASKKAFRTTMQTFFDLQDYLETSSAKILAQNPLQAQLSNDLRLGFRFYLFASLLNRDLDRFTARVLKILTPLSPRNIRAIAFSLFKGLKIESGKASWSQEEVRAIGFYGQVFDRHFLNGAYGRFERLNARRSARSTYRITHPNPFFLMVKFGDWWQEFFAACLRPTKTGLRRWVFYMTLISAYLLLPRLIFQEGLRSTAMVAAVAGAMFFYLGVPYSPPATTSWRKNLRTQMIMPFLALGLNAWLFVIDFLTR